MPIEMENKLTKRDIISREFQIKKFNVKHMVPTVTLTINVEADNLIQRKKDINGNANSPHLTVTHIILKAVAEVIVNYPLLYSFFDRHKIVPNAELILNIPVAIENHVEYVSIHNAESKSLEDIASECSAEIEKINRHEGEFMKLLEKMDRMSVLQKIGFYIFELKGAVPFLRKYYGNFPVSNIGSFKVNSGTLALSQPMVSSLCIGRITSVLQKENGNLIDKLILPLSVSFDHRALDGAYAGAFLNELKEHLEKPVLSEIE